MSAAADSIDPDELPDGWSVQPLGEIVTKLVDGSHNPPKKTESGQMMLSARNIENNKIVFDKYRYISDDDFAQEQKRTRITPGDVLLTIVGTIGRSAIVPEGLAEFTLQRSVAVITPSSVLPKYLMYQFQSGLIQRYFDENARGTAQKGVYLKTLSKTPIRVAPIDQQDRIVAEIEKQFSRLDEAVASLKRVKANLKRYKAAVLKAAVEGKLTEEWRKQNPDVEPASKLLERILVERRTKWEEAELAKMKAKGKDPKNDKWKEKYKEPEPLIDDQTFKIPASWAWVNLGQVSWSVKDGPHYSPKYSEEGIPFISGGNIRPDGIDFSSTKYISEELHEELSARCKPRVGDLLYTKGGTTGIAYFNAEAHDFNVWVHVAVIRILKGINGHFLQNTLNSSHCYRQSQLYTHGVGNQDLGLTRMIKITFPLPPFEEQKKINLKIDELVTSAAMLEEEIAKDISRAERLRQSVLARAFAGE